jgi:PTS system nitrogen regulatory IIA component
MTNKDQPLKFDSVLLNIHANSLKQLYQFLSDHVSQLIGASKQNVFKSLWEAEKIESAAIGQGVAIPHMRLARLTRPMVVLVRLSQPIEIQSHDDTPVDIVCLVLTPDYEGVKHLQRLAKVSRYFREESFCDKLRAAKTAQEIRQIVDVMTTDKMAA